MKGAATIMSIKLGAMLGGGSEKEIQALARYGRIFGTLAALREEFIDIFESEELNNRIQNECLPLPVLYALQDKNSTEIRRILSKRELSDGDITKLLDLVLESKQVRKLKNKMETLAKEACTLLLAIENRGSLNIFTQMVQTLTEDL
jgi:geranylgeranyl pyrophosphate synthase